VQLGEDAEYSYKRKITFPTLTGKAEKLYIGAYGEDIYADYAKNFDGLGDIKDKIVDTDDRKFCHRPHHDMESVIWVLIDSLVHAWPVGAKLAVTRQAESIMHIFNTHMINADLDARSGIERHGEVKWAQILHPDLHFLAPMMAQLSKFLSCDWTLWMLPEDKKSTEHEDKKPLLKADFLHEALKRLLLKEIIDIDDEKNIDVALHDDKLRHIPEKKMVVNSEPNQPEMLPAELPELETLPEDRDEDGEVEKPIKVESKNTY
jgi:hypothetical protein